MADRIGKAMHSFKVAADTTGGGKTVWCVYPAGKFGRPNRVAQYEDFANATADCDQRNAGAVLEAMRRPTEAMQLAAHNVRNDPATGLPTSCGTDEIYTAMIDAALGMRKG